MKKLAFFLVAVSFLWPVGGAQAFPKDKPFDRETRFETERRCDNGNGRACIHVARQIEATGVRSPNYLRHVAGLYRKACADDKAEGCAHLGRLHLLGDGVMEDPNKAALLFRRACAENDPTGCAGLGYVYLEGLGVEADHAESFRFFNRSCEAGNDYACANLGYLYELERFKFQRKHILR